MVGLARRRATAGRAAAHEGRPVSRVFTDATGERHWGVHGAAGLLVRNHSTEDGLTRYLLQRRGALVMHGGTWSTPGGAIDRRRDGSLETPLEAALREVDEECGGGLPEALVHVRTMRRDFGAPYGQPGSWSYFTVVMDSPAMFDLGVQASWEHGGSAWVTAGEMAALPLHPAFVDTALSLGMRRVRKDGRR
jgi:8-oxo-dGTP diphosphatase